MSAREISLPVFLDEHAQARQAFGAVEVPTVFLVNKNGVIVYRASGAEPMETRERLFVAFLRDELHRAN